MARSWKIIDFFSSLKFRRFSRFTQLRLINNSFVTSFYLTASVYLLKSLRHEHMKMYLHMIITSSFEYRYTPDWIPYLIPRTSFFSLLTFTNLLGIHLQLFSFFSQFIATLLFLFARGAIPVMFINVPTIYGQWIFLVTGYISVSLFIEICFSSLFWYGSDYIYIYYIYIWLI